MHEKLKVEEEAGFGEEDEERTEEEDVKEEETGEESEGQEIEEDVGPAKGEEDETLDKVIKEIEGDTAKRGSREIFEKF